MLSGELTLSTRSRHTAYVLSLSNNNHKQGDEMSDCCSKSCSSTEVRNAHRCPVNGKEYKGVSEKTILHHINTPWHWSGKAQNYYFCDDPECDVVYFGQDDSIIKKSELRTTVGINEMSDDALVCYCFGVTAQEAATDPEAREFVVKETKEHVCECEARNPSGKCCLKDFPKS